MRIFDSHIHVDNQTQAQEIIEFLDYLGIERGAILATDHGPLGEIWGTNVYNYSIASIVNNSKSRLVGIASLYPESSEINIAKFSSALEMGLVGLKLYPHAGFYPNDKRLYEVYSLASQKGVPVFIHSGIKALEWQRMVFNNPIIIDDIATSFPDLRIIIMHAGYPWTKEAFTVARLNKNVFLDITFLDVIDYTFEEGILEYIVKKASKILGASKIIWGSEGKYLKLNMYMDEGIVRIKKNLEEIITYKFLSSKEKEMVLFDNFNNLFEDNFSI